MNIVKNTDCNNMNDSREVRVNEVFIREPKSKSGVKKQLEQSSPPASPTT